MARNSEFQKGGRGKKAPYETSQVRVPNPLKQQIAELVDNYQSYVEAGGDPDNPPYFITNQDTKKDALLEKIITNIQLIERQVNAKNKGFTNNSFSQGIKLLKELFNLTKLVDK